MSLDSRLAAIREADVQMLTRIAHVLRAEAETEGEFALRRETRRRAAALGVRWDAEADRYVPLDDEKLMTLEEFQERYTDWLRRLDAEYEPTRAPLGQMGWCRHCRRHSVSPTLVCSECGPVTVWGAAVRPETRRRIEEARRNIERRLERRAAEAAEDAAAE